MTDDTLTADVQTLCERFELWACDPGLVEGRVWVECPGYDGRIRPFKLPSALAAIASAVVVELRTQHQLHFLCNSDRAVFYKDYMQASPDGLAKYDETVHGARDRAIIKAAAEAMRTMK